MRRGARAACASLLAATASCGAEVVEAPSCEELGVAIEASGPAERRVLGAAAAYEADPMIAARADELASSQRARREVAWSVVARVLAPVALAEATPVTDARVPAFRTWYDRDDVNAMFQHAFAGLGRERRIARDALSPGEVDATLDWHVRHVDTIVGWTPERFETYVAGLHGQAAIDGLGGFRRVAMSPDAASHILASYAEITACLETESRPAPFVDGPASTRSLARVPVALTRCHDQLAGPYFVARGGSLLTHLDARSTSGAAVSIRPSNDGLVGDATLCARDAGTDCEVSGPGAFFVIVHAGAEELVGTLEVQLEEPDVGPGCLAGDFPLGAATVAAHWERADQGFPLPTFDTSADGMRRRFDEGTYTWGAGDGEADPGADTIYTMTVPAGPSYRLAGLHIRTRELDHWLNITLWWSPDPDVDFGADRPASIDALGGPWSSYKMCVAVDFEERDVDPTGGFEADAPTLAAALREVHDGASWCSNPYIDAAPGLLRGNCVGCHQHAMGERAPGEIALDETRFPNGGRSRARNNEPSDGFWSLEVGDDVGLALRDTIAAWAAVD